MAGFLKHRVFLGATILGVALGAAAADRTETFQGIEVTVRGEGKPVLMIPGTNSAGAVWDETCAALQPTGIQCHIVQLPGFAGTPPAKSDNFQATMRDRLLAYLAAKAPAPAVVMGHSLGGALALHMAIKEPDRIERLVIVDALPFFAMARDPKATAESARPMASAMRERMKASTPEDYNTQLKAALRAMTRDASKVERLEAWGLASDRETTVQALYEIFSSDLRGDIAAIRKPTLVLGSWAAYAPFGATKEGTRGMFEAQFKPLAGTRVEMSEVGYHFLMWDDPQWFVGLLKEFITPGMPRR